MFTSTNPLNGEPFYPLSLIEYRAAHDPDVVWAKVPNSDCTYRNGFTDIIYSQFQNAIDGMSQWLNSLTGIKPGDRIAYFGPWDPRYIWMVLGANKTGYKVVFPALSLKSDALEKLVVKRLNCKAVISSLKPVPAPVMDLVTNNNLHYVRCPPVSYFIHEPHIHVPCKSYEEAADDTLAIMYTSGSKFDAKPIDWTNRFAASFLRQNLLEPPEGWESMDSLHQGVRLINTLPVLHCGSLYSYMLTAPLTKSLVHYPLPYASSDPEMFMELLEHVDEVDTAIMSPTFAEYIAVDPARIVKVAEKISTLAYAGGSLSTSTGDALSRHLKVYSLFTCIENGVYPLVRPKGSWDPERWRTVRFHPEAAIKLNEAGDGSYELFNNKHLQLSSDESSSSVDSFPDFNEWPTEDVFTPDPTELGSWLYSRRINDDITFTDGSTYNPSPYEKYLCSDSAIAAALIFGSQRPNVVLLLEPAGPFNSPGLNTERFLDLIWPRIEYANQKSEGRCKVSRSQIVITKPGKEIPRTGTGAFQRSKARLLYEPELVATLSL